ncbi:MAG: DUF445 domain-containing protein [Planctomycetota bacterium]
MTTLPNTNTAARLSAPAFEVDKSRLTTVLAAGLVGIALAIDPNGGAPYLREVVLSAGLFAFSGAVTNWIAIHMLFERIPGLYGSGVVQERFEAIRAEIRNLVLEEFFDEEHIARALSAVAGPGGNAPTIDPDAITQHVNTDAAFEDLVEVVMASKLGGALGMLGGRAALDPLKEPFTEKTIAMVRTVASDPAVAQALAGAATGGDTPGRVREQVVHIIDERVQDLTPGLVKQIVQRMIRDYLGWLVVWGGVFGGAIGVAASLISTL